MWKTRFTPPLRDQNRSDIPIQRAHLPIYRYKGKNEPKQELKINKYEGGFRHMQTYNADVRAIVLIQDAQIGQNTKLF